MASLSSTDSTKKARGSWIDINEDLFRGARERRASEWDHVSSRDDQPPSREGSMSSFLGSTSSLIGVDDTEWEEEEEEDQEAANQRTVGSNSSSSSSHALLLESPSSCLLVIDVQPEYWSQCPAVSQHFPEFPSQCSSLLAHFRRAGRDVVFVRANYESNSSKWLPAFQRFHGTDIMIPHVVDDEAKSSNTLQWETFATPLESEKIVMKANWNVCTGNDAFVESLKKQGVNTVILCGLITSVCVQHSAYGLFEAGFRVIVVTDACADRGRARHEHALGLYGNYLYEMTQVSDFE